MNSNNNSNHSGQPWMMPSALDHASETFNYMVSRPPGSVLPMPPQHQHQQHPHHQQQQQQQRQQVSPVQSAAMHSSNHQEQSASPPAQAHELDNPKNSKGSNRAVIPSKRAAQNRAAQKAFRQRREQYIKDLEIKAKEMEDWQEEMDKLRKENGELRERVAALENQVVVLTGGDASKIAELEKLKASTPSLLTPPINPESSTPSSAAIRKSPERSMSLPITRAVSEGEAMARRGSVSPTTVQSVKRSHHESRLRHEQISTTPSTTIDLEDNDNTPNSNIDEAASAATAGSFTRIPLRAPNPISGFETPSYHPTDHTPALIGNDTVDDVHKRRKLDDSIMGQQHQQQQQQQSTQQPMGQAPIANVVDANSFPTPMIHNSTNNPILISIQQEQPQLQHPPNDFWSNNGNANAQHMPADNMVAAPPGVGDFDLDFDFDPFFEDEFGPTITSNNDFLPNANSGQVLDDLFAMLQTRQRPQIPMVPSEETTEPSSNTTNFNDSLGRLG
ncbi:uncharacterized protein ATC70_000862 [Mucor velutinosus]|uniref:BZIP domain-containing protein n=1 Tax=Mucor velutinosus TaxID=708070 RepID=A0AAN7I1D9_9FUNG|nr:hypothetical protein ATC70_000862 [Mucor velutinosus]